tara:strand:+ start:4850 stop:5455 length:606 start_codon:yes stop_codon:yes gene_type:complete
MGDIIGKIKSNFLGQNNFKVGFNNKSPVPRKASPMNYSGTSFAGPGSVTSSYTSLMASNYGRPKVPDNSKMGDVLSKAVGQFGYMGSNVANELGNVAKEAFGVEKKDDGSWDEDSPWWRKSSKSPLNQNGDDDGMMKYNYVDPNKKITYNTDGENDPPSLEPVDTGKGDDGKEDNTSKAYQRKPDFDELSTRERIQELDWW